MLGSSFFQETGRSESGASLCAWRPIGMAHIDNIRHATRSSMQPNSLRAKAQNQKYSDARRRPLVALGVRVQAALSKERRIQPPCQCSTAKFKVRRTLSLSNGF